MMIFLTAALSLAVYFLITCWDFLAPASDLASPEVQFALRAQHAVSYSGHVSFSDISAEDARTFEVALSNHDRHTSHELRTRRITTHRPPTTTDDDNNRTEHSRSATILRALTRSSRHAETQDIPWEPDEVLAPDVESRETLLTLAKMTNNAYLSPGEAGWYDLDGNWSADYPVGWEPDDDGFRGHVFATPDNSTVVLAIKGTSTGFLGGGGPTQEKDKLNDNLLFSCCCAYVNWRWSPVCDCHRGGWKCNQDCVEDAHIEESLFYPVGINLYNNITYLYPNSNIWLVGHSLGGALAALLGVTFGMPTVAFESPGEQMAARRLHLPSPPSVQPVWHVYNTGDPIAMGTCNGVLSSCAIGGYAMESRCHQGMTIVYDTVSNLSWSVNIGHHGIVGVIESILNVTWQDAEKAGREVPEARPQEEDCHVQECYSWEYGNWTKKR